MRTISFKWGPQEKRGLTLVELMIAAALFLMAVISIFSLYTHNLTLLKENRLRARASQLLMEQLEHVRTLPYNQVVDGFMPGRVNAFTYKGLREDAEDHNTDTSNLDIDNMVVENLVEDYSEDPQRLKLITSRVIWSSQGREKTNEMQTIVAVNCLQNYGNQLSGALPEPDPCN